MKSLLQKISFSLWWLGLLTLVPKTSFAMHISDGILPLKWVTLWYLIAIPFIIKGLLEINKRAKETPSFKPLLGIVAAAIFIISSMPIPVPIVGAVSHPCGVGISAILVGPIISVVVSSIALLIQALFLAHGGLSAWGANIVSMGIAGSFAAYLAFRGLQRVKLPLFFCGFIAGILADWATYTLTSLELSLALTTNKPLLSLFFTLLIAFAPTQIPLGILEGFLTGGLVVFVAKRRPDILTSLQIIKNKTKKSPAKIISLLLPFLLLTSPGLAEPESKWGGIDEIVIEKIAKERGRTPSHPLLNLEQGDLPLLCFFLAGLIGGIILTICYQKLFAKKNNHNFPKHSTKP